MIFLSGCVTASSSICPKYPIAGAEVGKELGENCFAIDDGGKTINKCPNTFNWLDRLARFKEKLEAAQ